jgi:site-specific recombinase XerD
MQLELGLSSGPYPTVGAQAAPPEVRPGRLLQLVEGFLASVENGNTRRAYRPHLENAVAAMKITDVAQMTTARLAALRVLVVRSSVSPARQAQALCAVRSFLGWCSLIEATPHLSLDSARQILRLPQVRSLSLPQIPDDESLPRLFQLASVACGPRAMLAVFLGAGLRISELCSLELEDLQLRDGAGVLLVRGKGGKDRVVPVHPPVVAAVRAYVHASARADLASAPLFVAHDPGAAARGQRRISARSVRRRFCRLFRAAALTKRVTVHSLRHKFAMAMVEGGVDLNRIRAVLGHASLVTTQRYVDHLCSHHLRSAVPGHLVPDEPCPSASGARHPLPFPTPPR